ncbi:MAG: GxxExxY protein [Planctomycetota bacterium]
MHENDIAREIVDAAYKIHNELGPGLFESVYEALLLRELAKRGLTVCRQVTMPIRYEGLTIEEGFRADLVVEGKVIVELKSLEEMAAIHRKQLLTYLRLSGMKLGLLINFGEALFKDGVSRVVNGLEE